MLSHFFINRPIFATVLSILIVVAGVATLRSLPVEQYPTITPPTVVVEAQYPGANATTIAQMVATPIEQQVNGVEGMLYMSSTSSSAGVYRLTVTFEVGTDLDMATVLVQNRVNMTLSSLPQEVTKIGVTTTKESTNVVMFLTLTSDNPSYDALYLSNYAELNLVNELSRVKGIGSVGEFGAGNYSMRLWLNPDLLTIRGVSPQEIISAIESQNIQVAPGAVGAPPLASPVAFQYTLETQGLLVSEEEFGNIIVKTLSDGRYLRLKDVATIELGSQTYSTNALLKGQAVAAIAIYQLPGANALDVAQRIKARVNTLSSYLPEGVHLNITLDTTEFIRASVKEIYKTLGTAFLLVLIVILIFLQNWRAMLIPLIAIPVSLVGTFTFMGLMGFSINTLTLFGLVLAIGLVVDDAIIIVENSYRLIETGKYADMKSAVTQAMKEVSGAIVGIILVLLAVFIPTAFIGGNALQAIRLNHCGSNRYQRVQCPDSKSRIMRPFPKTCQTIQILPVQGIQQVFRENHERVHVGGTRFYPEISIGNSGILGSCHTGIHRFLTTTDNFRPERRSGVFRGLHATTRRFIPLPNRIRISQSR